MVLQRNNEACRFNGATPDDGGVLPGDSDDDGVAFLETNAFIQPRVMMTSSALSGPKR